MTSINTVEKLASTLERIDRRLMDSVSAYSNAAVTTDHTRIAVAESRIDSDRADRIIQTAQRREGEALSYMMEDMNDARTTSERDRAIIALETAGISSGIHGGWTCLRAGRHLLQSIRDLSVCRAAIRNGTNPPWGRERGAELARELTGLGVDCSGYLPV